MKKVKVPTAGIVAADILREKLLKMSEGEYLGSEAELISALGISIPTFRQTVRLLEAEQLLISKRGVGGGYFVKKPNPESIAHLSAVVLRSHNVSSLDLSEVLGPLMAVAAKGSVTCDDEALRSELKAYAEPMDRSNEFPYGEILETKEGRLGFGQLLSKMSKNPAILLFITIIQEVGSLQNEYYIFDSRERSIAMARLYWILANKILERDAESVEATCLSLSKLMTEWRLEDISHGNVSKYDEAALELIKPKNAMVKKGSRKTT